MALELALACGAAAGVGPGVDTGTNGTVGRAGMGGRVGISVGTGGLGVDEDVPAAPSPNAAYEELMLDVEAG